MFFSVRTFVALALLLSSVTQEARVAANDTTPAAGVLTTGYTAACGDKYSTTGNGCKKNQRSSGPRLPTTEVNSTEKHKVRCCSNTQPPPAIVGAVRNTGCAVWGYTRLELVRAPNATAQGCTFSKTYAEAEVICANNGGRLCTVQEILNRCTVASGCDYDHEHIWAKAIPPAPTGASYATDLLGCYVDHHTQHLSLKLGSPYSVDGCAQACDLAHYPFFGMKSGDTCYCGHTNDENSIVPATECNTTCIWGDGNCGGALAVSVYKTDRQPGCGEFFYEDKFRTCVKDTDMHFEYKLTGTFSIKECYEACTEASFALAALAEGGKCWCGDEEPLEQAYDCNVPCINGNGVCGGTSTSRSVSMYRTPVIKSTIKTLGLCKGQLANIWGDPHMVTFDNLKYNCQGIGHFTLTQCKDYKLQGIFKRATASATSVVHGIVAQYKSLPKVQVIITNTTGPLSVAFEMGKCFADLYIDGQVYNTSTMSLAQLNATSGIQITMDLKGFKVSFPQPGPAFVAKIRMGQGCLLDVDTCLHQECMYSTTNPVVGLLGTPNGDNKDEWMYRNATKYTGTDPYQYCTSVWCLQTASQSLFTYPPGTSFTTFDKCSNNQAPPPPPPSNVTVPAPILNACLQMAADATDENNCIMDILPDINNTERATGGVQMALENTIVITPDIDDIAVYTPPKNDCCPAEVLLYNTDGVTPLADIGILHLVERFPASGTITLQWYTYNGVNPARVYIEYENQVRANVCDNTTSTISKPFKIACPPNQMSAIVHVTVSDVDSLKAGDAASVNECCHPNGDPNPKVKYTFVIPCVDPCPNPTAEGRNRLLRKRL